MEKVLAQIRSFLLLGLLSFSIVSQAQISVTNTNDSGTGSLRQAILDANSSSGPDSIVFDAALDGSVINVLSVMTITGSNGDSTTINGDVDSDGMPNITLSGGSYSGLIVQSDSCYIKGLNLVGFSGAANSALAVDGSQGNVVVSNYVGTSLDGQSASTANFRGISMLNGATGNFIGDGTSSGQNIVSNNTFGVYINASDDNVVSGNIIGLDVDGTEDLGNSGSGVEVINSNNSKIGINGDQRNVISGNSQEGISLTNSTGTTIVNNYIGNPGSGSSDLGNDGEGILLDANSSSTTIGDGTSGGRNIIVFNGEGIEVGSDNNTIIGNYIGIAPGGSAARGNDGMGIYITSGATGNYIGDGTTAGRNVIGANSGNGILMGDGPNYVLGNYIGTNAGGSLDRGNGVMGIVVSGGTGNVIGGTTTGERNVISGNLAGISVTVADVTILGNYIGLRANGNGSIANDNEGIRLGVNAQNAQIGNGTQEGANFISGNTLDGVLLGGASVSGNTLNYNYIGLRGDMVTNEPNGGNGIIVESGANGNAITNNIISGNTENGIQLDGASTQYNTITQNSIYGNTLDGIDIVNGAQGGISIPSISDFAADGTLSGTSSGNETIEIFFVSEDEGDFYVASTTATGGSWSYDIAESEFPPSLDLVTVNATDASGNTSEFSSAIASLYDLFEVVNTNDEGGGSLRWCIDNAEASNDVSTITFNIPTTDPNYDNSGGHETWTIPVLSDFGSIGYPIILDASTQPGTGNFRIVLDGQNTSANGFRLNGTGSEVYGFYIRRFTNQGIYMGNPGETFTIGGIGKGNTIVENGSGGIYNLSANNCEFYGNFIGTNEDGDTGLGNGGTGIGFGTYANGGIIGGDDPGERNIISGNSGSGISFNVSGNTQIINNYIGTDPTGMEEMANNTGIYIGNSGNSTIRDNVISGNNSHGIFLFAGGNNHDIFNNKIGVASDGSTPLGNDIGVAGGSGADNNAIGGLGANEPNIIAHNTTYGVNFPGAGEDFNSIIGNAIYCNGKGINLGTTGNESKTAPVITSIVSGSISGTGNDTDVIHIYRDTSNCSPTQGSEYLGMTTVSGGTWTYDDGSIVVTDKLNATATDVNGNTSEFANDFGEIAVFNGPDNTSPELTNGQTELVYVGSGLQGANLDYPMTIDNLALVPLDVSSIDVAGIYYSIVSPPSVVDIQNSENFTVRLSQTTPGVFTSTVSINSNDDDENPFGFGIIGEMRSISYTKPGNALHFDGSDDYVSMNAGSLDIVGDLTLEAWIKLDAYPASAAVIISRANEGESLINNIQYQFRVQPDGKIGLVYEYGSGVNEISTSTGSVALDEWTHVAVSRFIDGSEADITFYIDGNESGTETLLNIPAGGTTGTPWIGSNNQTSFRYRFSGAIDELRVWDDVRDAGEIQAHLYSELTGDEDNLQAYFKFDHGIPDGNNTAGYFNLVNLAGGYHGILQNFTLNGSNSNYVGSEALFPNSAKAWAASNTTENGFTANFEVPNGVVDVLIDVDDDADFSSPLATGISAGTTGTLDISMTLTPGADYYFRTEADYGSLVSAKSVSRPFRVQPGNALDFDGSNDYVDLGNPDELRIAGDITLEAWIYLDGTSSNAQTIICHSGNGESTATNFLYQFAVDAANKLQLFFEYGGGGTDQFLKATEEVPLGEWVHVAVVRDATAKTVDFYMNGDILTPDGSNTYSTNATGGTGTGNRVWIGESLGSPGTRFFNGKIDELRVWSATRTQEEIDNNKFKTLSGSEANLVANYRFDFGDAGNDNSGITSLQDEVSGLDGTLNNFTLNGSNSNWVNSQGLLPEPSIPFAATDVDAEGFTANFEVPTGATDIIIDVDNDSDFSSPIVSGIPAGITGSSIISAPLSNQTDYFFRTQAIHGDIKSAHRVSASFRVQPGNALNFDGVDDRISVNDSPEIDFQNSNSLSISTWIKTSTTSQGLIVYKHAGGSPDGYFLVINNPNSSYCSTPGHVGFYVAANAGNDACSDTPLNDGKWHYLVGTYDNSLNEVKLYVDGILQADQGVRNGNLDNAEDLYFGWGLDGEMDELSIWDKALDQSEIDQNHYNTLVGNEPDLISYYQFDQGVANNSNSTITTLKDYTENLDGTLSNFALDGSVSNWVASDALAPESSMPLNATDVSVNGLTANFLVPEGATSIYVDLDDDMSFESPILSSLNAGVQGSIRIETGLSPDQEYFFRTRADHSGDLSNYSVSRAFRPKPGNGLSFDGVDDFVEIPDDDSLKIATQISITAWVKRTRTNNVDIILEKGGDWTLGSTNYGIGLHNDAQDNMFYFFYDGGWHGTPGPQDTEWHHFAVVAEEGQTSAEFYIDGVLQPGGLTNGNATISLDEGSTDPLYIGGQIQTFTYYSANVLDEIQIWDVLLTEAEIQSLMYKTLTGSESDLRAYYQFDEGVASGVNTGINVLPDIGISGNDGSLENFSLAGDVSNWVNSAAGLPIEEWDALQDIFNTTNGQSWTQKDNWLSEDLTSWFGLGVGGNRVLSLDLTENNAIGSINASMTDLDSISSLKLSGNQLTSLPDLSSLSKLSVLEVENNQLEFDDLESNIGISSISYSPQASSLSQNDLNLSIGDKLQVSVTVGGTQNIYQWKKDGVNLTDQTTATLMIQEVQLSDSGKYQLDVTNSLVTGLTLSTNEFRVSISGTSGPVVTASASKDEICLGESITLTASGAVSYTWDNDVTDGVAFVPTQTTSYTVIGEDENGNTDTTSVVVTVNSIPEVVATASDTSLCLGEAVTLIGQGALTYSWDQGIENNTSFVPVASNRFRLTGTDANGCTAEDSVDVHVKDVALPTIVLSEEVGRHLTLSANETLGTYQWLENGNELAGETSQTLAIIISAPEDDEYQVRVTEGECFKTSDPFFAPILGLQESGILIYPSPASDYVVVWNKDGFNGLPIRLFNTAGQLIGTFETNSSERIQLNVSGLKTGIYFIDLGEGLERIKIQKD